MARVAPLADFSAKDLFDFAVWESVCLAYISSEAQPRVDKCVRQAVEFVGDDKHFAAEKVFTEALGVLAAAWAVLEKLPAILLAPVISATPPATEQQPSTNRLVTSMSVHMVADFITASKAYRIAKCKSDDGRAIMAEASLHNKTWAPVSVDKKGYGTYYRGEPGMDTQSFKVVGVVHAEVVALACVLLELDLYKEWFPFCYFSEVIKEDSRFHKTSRFAIRCPWPLANREVAITGFGMDDLDNLQVVVKASSIEGAEPLKGNVMAELKLGGFYIQPVAKRDTKITFFMNIDPHIPNLPTFVLNWVSGNLMWVVLRQISKAAEKAMDPKSVYYKRRQQRPEVYEYFTKRATEVVKSLPDHCAE